MIIIEGFVWIPKPFSTIWMRKYFLKTYFSGNGILIENSYLIAKGGTD